MEVGFEHQSRKLYLRTVYTVARRECGQQSVVVFGW